MSFVKNKSYEKLYVYLRGGDAMLFRDLNMVISLLTWFVKEVSLGLLHF